LSAAAVLVPTDPAPVFADASPVSPAETSCVVAPTPPVAAVPALPSVTFDPFALVEPDLWPLIPSDVAELLALLPHADLYVQDEVDIRHLPTLTRVWSHKGHAGQRKVRAPGYNQKAVGFVAVDWRDGWCAWGLAPRRTADTFVEQLDFLVARSQQHGRVAVVLLDNLKIHTPAGAKKVRTALETHGANLRLVHTPAYDPEANPIERLFPPFRSAVTHNHHRDNAADLYRDAIEYFQDEDNHPDRALRHIGSPFATEPESRRLIA
jgi:hypothetical protein